MKRKLKYRIRPVYSSNFGNGYELLRLRWYGNRHVAYAWLQYEKNAPESLREIVRHMGGEVVGP